MNLGIIENYFFELIEDFKEVIMDEDLLQKALSLMDRADFVMLGNNDIGGYPSMKAMLNMEHDGIDVVWFSTNTSSHRVKMFKKDNRASIYYVDPRTYEGLLLFGRIEIKQDKPSKERLWRNGFEVYYPLGIDEPDYTVLKFTAERGNYYYQLKITSFDLPGNGTLDTNPEYE